MPDGLRGIVHSIPILIRRQERLPIIGCREFVGVAGIVVNPTHRGTKVIVIHPVICPITIRTLIVTTNIIVSRIVGLRPRVADSEGHQSQQKKYVAENDRLFESEHIFRVQHCGMDIFPCHLEHVVDSLYWLNMSALILYMVIVARCANGFTHGSVATSCRGCGRELVPRSSWSCNAAHGWRHYCPCTEMSRA